MQPAGAFELDQRGGDRACLDTRSRHELIGMCGLAVAGAQHRGRSAGRRRPIRRTGPPAGAAGQTEREEGVGRIEERVRTVGKERIAACGRRVAPRPGHCQHGAAVLDRVLGRDARAAVHGRLHDDDDVGEYRRTAIVFLVPSRAQPLSAVIYVRISRDPEGLRAGVERQRVDCLRFCEERRWSVLGVYEDNDTSAYSGTPRNGYEALLRALKVQRVDALVCWHPDRLHRSPKELETFIDLIDATGVSVHSVTAGDFDLSSAEGRMLARITGSVARHESERKSERVRRAKQQEAAEGRFHGGGRPFGYQTDGVTLDRAEAELIREAARKIVRGGSCRSIANDWNAAGVLTPRGGRWVGQVVRRVLLSPRIRGYREYRGEIVGKGAWEPILDPEAGASVEAVLLSPDRVTNGGVIGRRNYLAGYVFCGRCETRLFTAVVNKMPGMSCRKGSTPTGCGRLTVKTAPLDAMVRSIVVERLLMAPRTLALASEAGRGPRQFKQGFR